MQIGGGAAGEDGFLEMAHAIARGIEVAGIGVIVLGAALATLVFLLRYRPSRAFSEQYHEYRANLGRAILLGLELLVAADIIGTVAVAPTLGSVAVLAGIVLIRTFLSFSLELEINGYWPWEARRYRERAKEPKAL